jgi:sporulation protein YunB
MRFSVRRRIMLPSFPRIHSFRATGVKLSSLSKKWIIFGIIIGLGIYMFDIIESHLKPTLLAIAEARATVIATTTINNVISEEITKGVDYRDLVSVRVDDRGRVVLMQPNTVEFNRLASHITIKVQEGLRQITNEKISIPVGQVLGSQMLASYGPKITVTVIPLGTVQVKVMDTFEQAGINQTKHMIYIVANTQVRIVIPLVIKSVEVVTRVPISESVVVGEVPNTYVQFPFPLPNMFNNGDGNGQNGQ